MMESLTNECLKNPYIWALAIIYFFVYTVRQGVTSWFIFYLLKVSTCSEQQCDYDCYIPIRLSSAKVNLHGSKPVVLLITQEAPVSVVITQMYLGSQWSVGRGMQVHHQGHGRFLSTAHLLLGMSASMTCLLELKHVES